MQQQVCKSVSGLAQHLLLRGRLNRGSGHWGSSETAISSDQNQRQIKGICLSNVVPNTAHWRLRDKYLRVDLVIFTRDRVTFATNVDCLCALFHTFAMRIHILWVGMSKKHSVPFHGYRLHESFLLPITPAMSTPAISAPPRQRTTTTNNDVTRRRTTTDDGNDDLYLPTCLWFTKL